MSNEHDPARAVTALHATIDGREQVFPLTAGSSWRLGRELDCDIVVADHRASRFHATLHRDAAGAFHLSDSGSRNGTLINGRQLATTVRLVDGDRIEIGGTALVFRDHEQAEAEPARQRSAEATQFFLSRDMVSVLVTDVRGFTEMSRRLGEERISAVMSDYFREAGKLLDRRGCWAQKYIGDAVMGVWRHPELYVPAPMFVQWLELVEEFRALAAEISARFALDPPLRFGGAINTGYASTGNMGSAGVADFTALGDAVNKAFRLESGCKDLHCDFLIAEQTIELIRPAAPTDCLPPPSQVMLKGYDRFEPIFAFDFEALAGLGRAAKEAAAAA